jgi:hypothetical protein
MSYLEDLNGKTISINGVALPDRKRLNIVSSATTGTDNPGTQSTDLAIVAGTVEDNTVTTAKIVDGAVTASKIDDPNGLDFAEGGTSTKAGYFDVTTVTDLADTGDTDITVDLSDLGDGMYIFTVNAVATAENASVYFYSYGFRARRSSSTLAGDGLTSPVFIPTEDGETEGSEYALTFSDDSGDLNVNLESAIGGGLFTNAIVCTALIFIPVPAAPVS